MRWRRVFPSRVCLVLTLLTLLTVLLGACSTQRRPALPPAASVESLTKGLPRLEQQNILDHLAVLTAAAMAGRAVGTAGEQRAAAYIKQQLIAYGLQPWHQIGLTDYSHSFAIPGRQVRGENVLAVLPGESDDWLLLTAHYDHLGVKQNRLYPGADDNASSVAVLLELARCYALSPQVPRCNVAFVFLSGEEADLLGSTALAQRLSAYELQQQCRLLNMDMLGGTGGNSLDIWAERSRPSSQPWMRRVRHEIQATGLPCRIVRRRLAVVDSRPFARRGIPSVTLSWAYGRRYHPHRHRPSDTVPNLQPALLARAAEVVWRVGWILANSD